ncbi:MAG: IS982 family transposase [Candidatus Kerfeldbacteria bacterium]|nr:IS982 family transposase [Candidatus Kerfeldbacteria bacterium]
MLSLEQNHITELYVWVDDSLPKTLGKPGAGRPSLLSDSEILTVLLWNAMLLRQKNLKDIHRTMRLYHFKDFPIFPQYSAFVSHCHKLIPMLHFLLQSLLEDTAPLRILDSTMLPVCKLIRADSHKVALGVADFGKNWQGWHFGFKLHASITPKNTLSAVVLTPASFYDAQAMPKLLNKHARLAVGDTLYGASVMGKKIWEEYGTIVIAPPHPKQKKKIATFWQIFLLEMRPKIESVWDYLKEHMHLISSFPRSVSGYILHYLRILLGYQLLALSSL